MTGGPRAGLCLAALAAMTAAGAAAADDLGQAVDQAVIQLRSDQAGQTGAGQGGAGQGGAGQSAAQSGTQVQGQVTAQSQGVPGQAQDPTGSPQIQQYDRNGNPIPMDQVPTQGYGGGAGQSQGLGQYDQNGSPVQGNGIGNNPTQPRNLNPDPNAYPNSSSNPGAAQNPDPNADPNATLGDQLNQDLGRAPGPGSQGEPPADFPGAINTTTNVDKVSDAPGGVLRFLDKVSGTTVDLTLKKGETGKQGRLSITLVDCRYPVDDPASNAFAYLKIRDSAVETPIFSGWMIASSPALNPLNSARYDVWVLHCTKP